MKAIARACSSLLVALSMAAPLFAIDVPELGSLDFPNSGSEAAQQAFARGVLLLHSFEYEDAREAFQEARAVDPGFALAYWGEAMTHNHPLWRQLDLAAARSVLAALGATTEERLAKAPSEREKGYLRAVEALFFGPDDKVARDEAYEEAMRALSAAYPDDLEAKAFHALSILGTAQGVRDFRVYMRAGAVAEEVFAANPRHPGAAHYLIHSYDDPIHAPLGLRAARVYAEIAPAASHAQHMISHIFVGLGWWAEAVAANVKAWDVSVERAVRKGLGVDARNYHALHWLQYAHLQQGRHRLAAAELDRMREMASESRSPRALWYHAAMRAAQVVEAGAVSVEPPAIESPDLPWVRVFDGFTRGWRAAAAGEAGQVHAAAAAIRQVVEASRKRDDQHADAHGSLSEEDRSAAEVMALELDALADIAEGDATAAVASLEAAAELEASRALEFGPPVIVKPSHELLGEVLLDLGRSEEALERFEGALERAPRRVLSLAGQARAARSVGNEDLAARACEELDEILAGADEIVVGAPCGRRTAAMDSGGRRLAQKWR
jgi:tetratricopeptide (TPR) repeat protein